MSETANVEPSITEEERADHAAQSDGVAQAGRRRRPWRVRLAVLACTAWLAFVVLHRLLSNRFYWWGPFDVIPPLAFALIPLALIAVAQLARPVRWRLTAAPVLALVLGLSCSGLNFSTLWYTPPSAPSDAIKLVTWNTQYWDQDLQPGGPHTTDGFYAFLRGLDADVYLLQEYAHVDMTKTHWAQARGIDQAARLRAEFPGYEVVIEGRNVTLSRLPVVGHRWLDTTTWLPDDLKPVPDALRDRPLFYSSQTQVTDIRVNGKTVSFYNSHLFQPPQRLMRLQNGPEGSMFEVDRLNFEMRRASYEAIRKDVADNPHRIVLGGDLNTSAAMGIKSMIPDRLVDQSHALPSLYPASWPSGKRVWRLDWLFTTSNVAVSRYDLLDSKGFSDHSVQRVTLWPR
ncbi:endonuclease/exonuclease/phosphatase family protein [Streptomyces sp. NBC_00683]|uniref:endonuclease/exonuclease/phosphatase family protein n=1 Tax=Streptomyces sp. NBC_00683 TaxID=2903670 RepID=UPI002E30B6F4|nr:endonuclease/exonuclease/phosphatase family protein [Streptomyces sp. NBC_00683]